MKIRDILGDDLDTLLEAGLTRDEIISIAKIRKPQVQKLRRKIEDANYKDERKRIEDSSILKGNRHVDSKLQERFNPLNKDNTPRKIDKNDPDYASWRREQEAKIQQESQKETQKIKEKNNVFGEDGENQGFLDRVIRGAKTTAYELNAIGSYATGQKVDPVAIQVIEDSRAKDREFVESIQSEDRKKETKKLEEGFEEADGAWQTTKEGAKLLYDKASNPSEWNMGGVVGELINPVNFVGLGSGAVAGKVATKGITKALVGGATGAVTQGAFGGGYEYLSEKAQGKTDKEAQKAGIMGTVAGASMGAVLGGYAGYKTSVRPKIEAKVKEKHKDIDITEIVENELMQLDEAETHSNKAQTVIEQASKQARNPQELNDIVMHYAPPTPKEEAVSFILNYNKPVSPRFAGGRVRNALVKSIENPKRQPEEMQVVLMSEGFTEETSRIITRAYHQKDVTLYDDFVADRMGEVIDATVIKKHKLSKSKTKLNNKAEEIKKASEIPVGGSEDEAKARVKTLFRTKEKPKTYDKEELENYTESYFRDTFNEKELDNAIAHLPKNEAKKVMKARNSKADEKSIEILENLRRDGFPHMDEEIAQYEKLTDKYFDGDKSPTVKEEARIEALEVELKDYFDKEEYIDARTKRKELETLSDDAGYKSSQSKGNEPQRGSSPSEGIPKETKGTKEDVKRYEELNNKKYSEWEDKLTKAEEIEYKSLENYFEPNNIGIRTESELLNRGFKKEILAGDTFYTKAEPDGTILTEYPSGTRRIEYPDGEDIIIDSDGSTTTSLSLGNGLQTDNTGRFVMDKDALVRDMMDRFRNISPTKIESQNKSVSNSKSSVAPIKGLKTAPTTNKKSKNKSIEYIKNEKDPLKRHEAKLEQKHQELKDELQNADRKKAKKDFKIVKKKLEKFEGENVGDDGKYLTGLEGC